MQKTYLADLLFTVSSLAKIASMAADGESPQQRRTPEEMELYKIYVVAVETLEKLGVDYKEVSTK